MAGTLVVGEIQTESNGNLTLNPNGSGNVSVNDTRIVTTTGNQDIELEPNGTGAVEIRGNTNAGTIKLNCENNSHAVSIQSPAHASAATYTLVLPTSTGSANQILDIASVSGSTIQLGWADDAGALVTAANEWTAGQRGEVTTVTQSNGDLAINFDLSNNFYVLPSQNITGITFTGLDADMIGQSGSIFFQQPNSGNFTVSGWPSTARWAGGTGGGNNAPTFTATANTTDRVDYVIASTGNTTTNGDVVVQLVHTANYAE